MGLLLPSMLYQVYFVSSLYSVFDLTARLLNLTIPRNNYQSKTSDIKTFNSGSFVLWPLNPQMSPAFLDCTV